VLSNTYFLVHLCKTDFRLGDGLKNS